MKTKTSFFTKCNTLVVLTNHFLKRFGGNSENHYLLAALFLMIGLVATHLLFFQYILLQPLDNIWHQKAFFNALVMALSGIFCVIFWEHMFFDRKDFLNLLPLPVKLRTLLAGKLSGVLIFNGIVSVLFNLTSALSLFCYLSVTPNFYGDAFLTAAVYFLANFLAALFVFFLTAVLQNILVIVCGERVSAFGQPMLLVGYVGFLFWFNGFSGQLNNIRNVSPEVFRFVPPMWFTGMQENMAGNGPAYFSGFTSLSFLAVAVTAGLYFGSLLVRYRVYSRLPMVTARKRREWKWQQSLEKKLNDLFLANPIQRGVFYFVMPTLSRSRFHKRRLLIYILLPAAFVVYRLSVVYFTRDVEGFLNINADMISIPVILFFFTALGLRTLVKLTITPEANWVFKMTQETFETNYLIGMKKAFYVQTILPVLTVLFFFYMVCWGIGPTLLHIGYAAVLAVLLFEFFFISYRKIPFVYEYEDAPSNLKSRWPLYLAGLGFYTFIFTMLGLFLVLNPVYYLVFYPLSYGLHYVVKRHFSKDTGERFSIDKPEPVFLSCEFGS